MNKPKISVLVPCYNNAKWMRGCLQSIADQTLTDIEVLLADDGSTDSEAIAIIDEFVAKDSRFKLDRHENIGCGKSLNRLLDVATGTYIAEIDCDDEFEINALETLYNLSKDGTVDVVKGSFTILHEGHEIEKQLFQPEICNKVICISKLAYEYKAQVMCSAPSLWSGIYKKTFLADNHIRWRETPGACYQDTSFSIKTKAMAKTMVLTNELVYRYQWDNPVASTKTDLNYLALSSEYDDVESYIKQRDVVGLWPILAKIRFQGMIWMLMRLTNEEHKVNLIALTGNNMSSQVLDKRLYSSDDWNFLMKITDKYGTRMD